MTLAVAGAVLAGLACGKKAEPAKAGGTASSAPTVPETKPAGPEACTAADLESFQRMLTAGGWKATDPLRNAQGLLTAVHERTGLTFVLVPPGTFTMGSPPETEGDRDDDEEPHRVTIARAFLLSATECTQEAWDRVGGIGIDSRSRRVRTFLSTAPAGST